MATATISKKISKKADLVTIPRIQYEGLLRRAQIDEIRMTTTQIKALKEAERELKFGKTLSIDELGAKLGFRNKV